MEDSVNLLSRFRAGDPLAAAELHSRYVQRLMALARTRISRKLGRRVGADDVVQSVFRSFFTKARDQQFVLEQSGDLWRLLSCITVTKVLRQAQRQRRQKRSIDLEESICTPGSAVRIPVDLMLKGPSAWDAMVLLEELESILAGLKPLYRQILELRLQGEDTEQIAQQTARSERTVRRVLETIKQSFEERLIPQP